MNDKNKSKIKIVVIGDLHCGHKVGLNENIITPKHPLYNPYLPWCYNTYLNFTKENKNPDLLVVLGDPCDGSATKNKGKELLFTDVDEQASMAARLIKKFKAKKTIIIVGSGYHEGHGQSLSKQLSKELINATFKEYQYTLKIGNEIINFRHDAGLTYASLLKEMENYAVAYSTNNYKHKPTINVRAHGHRYRHIEQTGMKSYIIPAWEYLTDFMNKSSFKGFPDIGGMIITYDNKTKKVNIEIKTITIPQSVINKMNNLEKI